MHLLIPHLFPSVSWMKTALSQKEIGFHANENYVRQTYRNRYEILTAQGRVALSVPVVKKSSYQTLYDVKVSYAEKWAINHWRTLTASYKNSPYFEHYESEFHQLFTSEYEYLYQWIEAALACIYRLMQRELIIKKFDSGAYFTDFSMPEDLQPYLQVFTYRFPFEADLSFLDLVFNQGPEAVFFLS